MKANRSRASAQSPMTTITMFAMAALGSCGEAIQVNAGSPAAAAAQSRDLAVRRLAQPADGGQDRIEFDLIAPRTGHVMLFLRSAYRPRHEDWQVKYVGERAATKSTSRQINSVATAPAEGQAATSPLVQSSLSFYIPEQDVGSRIRFTLALDTTTGAEVLDDYVARLFGAEHAESIRGAVAEADSMQVVRLAASLTFPGRDGQGPERNESEPWGTLILRSETHGRAIGFRGDLAVPGGEMRGVGFMAFSRQPSSLGLNAVFDAEDTSIVVASGPFTAEHGTAAILELGWQPDDE
ncbi:MAG: hypothetical protein KDC98_23060 [Planctomycetes bacterium]|nr:hypothetical protein [Planctomycetota bacterium]